MRMLVEEVHVAAQRDGDVYIAFANIELFLPANIARDLGNAMIQQADKAEQSVLQRLEQL
jgi:hypothetical protein